MGDGVLHGASRPLNDPHFGVRYPRFARRIRAMWIDAAILIALYVAWIFALGWLYKFPPFVRAASLLLPALLLEPALVAWTGGTLGHHAVGIRVRDVERDRPLGFLRACARAALKSLLGWASLAFALVGHRHQAIHDAATRSLVVLKNPARLPASEVLESRVHETQQYRYPSRTKMVLMILAWWIGVTAGYLLLLAWVGASECDPRRGCGLATPLVVVLNYLWTMSVLSIPALGWFGRLLGARRIAAVGTPGSEDIVAPIR